MPIFEVAGHDRDSHAHRAIQVSARDEVDAARTAMSQGLCEVKLRTLTDREILMMEEKCFLNSGAQQAPAAPRLAMRGAAEAVGSVLLDHPFIVITGSVFCALMLDRLVGLLLTQL